MKFDEYFFLACNAAFEGKDLSALHAKAMDTFGKEMIEEAE